MEAIGDAVFLATRRKPNQRLISVTCAAQRMTRRALEIVADDVHNVPTFVINITPSKCSPGCSRYPNRLRHKEACFFENGRVATGKPKVLAFTKS